VTSEHDINSRMHIALVHYPVYDRRGEITASALTTLDVHDLSRLARTYDIGGYYVVTPLRSQQALAGRLIDHWITGWGATYNATRGEALSLVHITNDVGEALTDVERRCGSPVKTVATAARRFAMARGYEDMVEVFRNDAGRCYLILFGTGWGLTRELIETCDFILEPIEENGYNHLSVRSAAAIVLDRLLGRRQP
jgi:hypothetical protein